jgi:hypothetical protein
MNLRSAAAALILVFGPLSLAQKDPAPALGTGLQIPRSAAGAGCPVSLRVEHLSDGSMVKTRGGQPRGVGQWLHFTLNHSPWGPISTATLIVHGLTNKPHMTLSKGPETSDSTERFTLRFPATSDPTVSADLWVPGMTATLRVDLEEVVDRDGFVRQLSQNESCHFIPNPLMWIASR